MIEQRARVVGSDGGHVLVEAARAAGGCGSCSAQSGCGVSKLGRLLPGRPRLWRVPNDLAAQAGDDVTLGLPDEALLGAALAAYAPPLVGMLAGSVTAGAWVQGNLWPMLGAAGGLVLGLAVSRVLSRRWKSNYEPRMVARHACGSATPAAAPRRWPSPGIEPIIPSESHAI